MKLHLLGVNGPFPDSHGATSGYLLEAGKEICQLDFGCGILSELTSLAPPEDLSALFISHWHYDHTADIPVLMYRLEACHRCIPVYGPADPSSWIYSLVTSSRCFTFHEIIPGQDFPVGPMNVKAFSARHPVPAVGYRFEAEGKELCYTGDTNTLDTLKQDCIACDLLLADGLFPAGEWNDKKPHLSAELAARLASETGAKRLLITHLNPFYPKRILLDEARAVFPGAALAESGDVIAI